MRGLAFALKCRFHVPPRIELIETRSVALMLSESTLYNASSCSATEQCLYDYIICDRQRLTKGVASKKGDSPGLDGVDGLVLTFAPL